jgi:hypothetical protein
MRRRLSVVTSQRSKTDSTSAGGQRAWSSSSNLSAWMFDFGKGMAFNYGGQVTYTRPLQLWCESFEGEQSR